jgi:Glycoside-hydrolase family GH114
MKCLTSLTLLLLVSACGSSPDGESRGRGTPAAPAPPLAVPGSVQTPGNAGSGSENGAAGSAPAPTPGRAPRFQPAVGTTWQWQLDGLPLDLSIDVEVYDVDLVTSTDAEFERLRAAGRTIICYLSAGTWEPDRPDSGKFAPAARGAPLEPPFGDEEWLDIRSSSVRALIQTRLDTAVTRGCDAVEPDNMDGYDNDNGLSLSAADQLDYNRFVAAEAHARGLSVGLKNDLEQLSDLVADFDWALNEECFRYDECDAYEATFIAAGKAVFHAEYADEDQLSRVCAATRPLGLSTIIKRIDLDAWRLACP